MRVKLEFISVLSSWLPGNQGSLWLLSLGSCFLFLGSWFLVLSPTSRLSFLASSISNLIRHGGQASQKMKHLINILLISLLFGCSADPRAINYGEDVCHHCKMKLMDPKYGAEVVTQKGKIFIFDDVNCLMSFLESDEVNEQDLKHILITDYDQTESLSDATISFYLKSEAFKTPMASNIIAFSDYETLKKYKKEHGGVYLAWGELVTQFK